MGKYAFDPSEAARWHIPIPKPLPPIEAGAFDEPRNCFGINMQWMIFVVVCSDILADRRTWEDASAEQLNFIQQQVGLIQSRLLRDTDCTEADCPDPTIMRQYDERGCYRIFINDVPQTDWICPAEPTINQQIGVSSDTIGDDEMPCINIAGLVKIEAGKLYAKDDCCNWQLIGDLATLAGSQATAPTNFGAVAAISGGVASLVNGLPSLTPVPHPTTAFNNEWTRKCLKATSLKYVLRTLIADSLDALEQIPDGWAAFLGAVGLFLKTTPLAEISIVADVAAWASEFSAEILVPLIEESLADTEAWNNFVCDFATVMTGVDSFTGQDVTNFYTKAVTYEVIFAEWFISLLNKLIPLNFQARVNEYMSSVTCECDDYIPVGYTPPLPSGSFQMTAERLYKSATSTGFSQYPEAGEPFENIDTLSGSDGNLSGNYPTTENVAHDSGAWWEEYALIIAMSGEATITSLKMTVVYPLGEPPSGQAVGAKLALFEADNAEWTATSDDSDNTSPYKTEWSFSPGNDHVTFAALRFYVQSPDSGTPYTARAVSIRASGTYGGGDSFTELEIGEIHTP